MTERVKVLLVEDHPHMRRSLRRLLEADEAIEIVGEASDGREGVEMCVKLHPDVVLLDVGLPIMDGIEACRMMREKAPESKIIMLTSHNNERDIFASLAAGANGYCLKDSDFRKFPQIVQTVKNGDLWLDAAIAGKVLKLLPSTASTLVSQKLTAEQQMVYEPLSKREVEVLELLVDGLSNSDIAARLGIGIETVKTHIKSILGKLAVSDRTQAAIKALRAGII
ncbi:MAG: response regulator transcription factor [Leptolyngbya sp.]|nr:response regulator transcription factor [Candidatus Melainabacteria bacterium]